MIKPSFWMGYALAAAGGLCAGAPALALAAQSAGAGPLPPERHALRWAGDALRLSPPAAIAKPTPKAKASASAKSSRSRALAERKPAKPRQAPTLAKTAAAVALDLNLPQAPGSVAAADTLAKPASGDDAAPPAFDFSLPTDADPNPGSSALFNRDNGLRGFMADNWVNPRFGFQGGLAISPQRLRDNNSDLTDKIAVGMGVLLAF